MAPNVTEREAAANRQNAQKSASPPRLRAPRPCLQGTRGFCVDPLLDVEIDELAWLLWRKQRVERARDSNLVALKDKADTEGRRRKRDYPRDTVNVATGS
jgi:hypothetical protein